MRLMTWNVNGLRSALKKGLPEVLQKIRPQVVLLQEVRAFPEDLPSPWANPPRWHVVWNPAEKPGYSGTAIWSRTPIEVLERGLGGPDQEGRVLVARTGGIVVGCLYLPSGSSSEARQTVKDRMLVEFTTWAEPWRKKSEPICLAGDFNVAPTERDIYHWKSNQKTSGFLPHERAWFANLLQRGWHDPVRDEAGEQDGPYTWWSNRGQARALDRGWRIDHWLLNEAAKRRCSRPNVHRQHSLGVSDHAPVTIDLDSR